MNRILGAAGAAMTLVLAAAGGGCGESGEAADAGGPATGPAAANGHEIPVNVRVLTVEPTTLREYLTLSGRLKPYRATDISTEERGVVAELPRDKGAAVRRGDVVIGLDRDLLAAERKAAEATRELRAYTEVRTRKLHEEKQVSRQELLQVETDLATAAANADIARLRWERASIKAPFDGIVADRYVELGQLVTEGTPVARLVDPRILELVASVSEREVRWLQTGAPATVILDGVAAPRAGRVHWVSFEADPATGKFRAEIRVDNADGELRPGVVARAEVMTQVHEAALAIPRDAIVSRPDGKVVFVADGDRARERRVKIGADQGLMAVVSEGLAGGERIVVRGQRELLDGSLLSVTQEATSSDGTVDSDPPQIRASGAFTPTDGADTEGTRP